MVTSESSEEAVASTFVFLDESMVQACLAHSKCEFSGKSTAGPTCVRRYLYGVGACVFESHDDLDVSAARLTELHQLVAARNGVMGSRRSKSFGRDGWHATDDLPEFQDPFIFDADQSGSFKGHVRYTVRSGRVHGTDLENLYRKLFVSLLTGVLRRYGHDQRLQFVFETDGTTDAEYHQMVLDAGGPPGSFTATGSPKGDVHLAVADYLLYATMQYLARVEELCGGNDCRVAHGAPVGNQLAFDRNGAVMTSGHVLQSERWHRMYFAFAKNMSSVVLVPETPTPSLSSVK